AGNAYASTIVSALALGKTLEEGLRWAGINSMSVTQYVGAQKGLLSIEKIEEYLAKAPDNYKPQKL
ncbi:MAG: Sugar kinase, ribokinase family, partial [Parcubacteria group bacterium GW2011_GWF2_39_8b]